MASYRCAIVGNMFQYESSFNDRGLEVGVCRLLTIYHIIRRQQRRDLISVVLQQPLFSSTLHQQDLVQFQQVQ